MKRYESVIAAVRHFDRNGPDNSDKRIFKKT